jgi:predicted aspartyl protease
VVDEGKRRSIHLFVEIDEDQVHGLVDAWASMFVISTSTIRELGLMHLVASFKIYKTVLSIIT